MLKKLFGTTTKKVQEEVKILIPMTGKLQPLESVPDEVFSQKLMGDGFAIEPSQGAVVAPVSGKVISFFPAKHAIAIMGTDGTEVLIHVGIDTVTLNGKGFEAMVVQEQQVKAGEPLIHVDLEYIQQQGLSTVTPVIFTNGRMVELLTDQAEAGDKDAIRVI